MKSHLLFNKTGAIFFLYSLCLSLAFSQELTSQELLKTSDIVIKNAEKGIAQEVIVTLNGEVARKRFDERVQANTASGKNQSQAEKNAELSSEFQKLQNEVFPNGKLNESTVLSSSKFVAVLIVRVPNYKSLVQILKDPRVTGVREQMTYPPAVSQSLPLIQQPSAISSG
jgi:hypothetical protein